MLDTSVLTRFGAPSIVQRIEELDSDGLARTTMTDLEIGCSARNADEWDRLVVALGAFRRIEVEAHHFERASQVQRKLAADGLEGRNWIVERGSIDRRISMWLRLWSTTPPPTAADRLDSARTSTAPRSAHAGWYSTRRCDHGL